MRDEAEPGLVGTVPRVVRAAVILAGLVLAGCGSSSPPVFGSPPDPERLARFREAVDVWTLDPWALHETPRPAEEGSTREAGFRLDRLDAKAIRFLREEVPYACENPVCGLIPLSTTDERRIEEGLDDEREGVRLLALTLLMRKRAPTSVAEQWRALEDLGDLRGPAEVRDLLEDLATAFSPKAIDALLARPAPTRWQDADRNVSLEWAARAAGVREHAGALPRLAELTASEEVRIAYPAVWSVGELPGEGAVDALVRCLEARGIGARPAAQALFRRAPERLERALLSSRFDDGWYDQKGFWLAEFDNPLAVPLLCESVSGEEKWKFDYSGRFDAIARLARPEHLAIVEALPDRVPVRRRRGAVETVEAVRQRLRER